MQGQKTREIKSFNILEVNYDPGDSLIRLLYSDLELLGTLRRGGIAYTVMSSSSADFHEDILVGNRWPLTASA